MTTTGVLWPSLSPEDGSRIRKWLYGNVFARDWDAAGSTAMTTATNSLLATDGTGVFASNGNLNPNLLLSSTTPGQYGFVDIGNITDAGVEFNPEFTTDETYVWQSRKAQRADKTKDDESVMFSAADTTPLTDYLWYDLPIGANPAGAPDYPSLGSSGYSVSSPFYSDVVYRQLLIIGVDGSVGPNGQPEYVIELRPRVALTKKAKRQWGSKQVDVKELTYTCFVDPFSGSDRFTLRGGTVWLDEGGPVTLPSVTTLTATATSSPTHSATVVFNQPTSPNQPFTYTTTMRVNGAGGYIAVPGSTAVTASGVVTVTVTGLTPSSTYTFEVVATASNGDTATYPTASGSITAT